MLRQRVISAAILIPAVILAIRYAPYWLFTLLFGTLVLSLLRSTFTKIALLKFTAVFFHYQAVYVKFRPLPFMGPSLRVELRT